MARTDLTPLDPQTGKESNKKTTGAPTKAQIKAEVARAQKELSSGGGDPLKAIGDFITGNTGWQKSEGNFLRQDTPTNVSAHDLSHTSTPAKKATKKKKAASTSTDMTTDQIFSALANALVTQNQTVTNEDTQLIEGTGPVYSSAQNAASAIGQALAPSGTQGWLQQNIAQANQTDQPLQQAMNAYASAYSQGEANLNAAIGQVGTATDESLQAAPYANYLQAVQQGTSSPYYLSQNPQALSNLPVDLQYALYKAGVSGISVPKGGWPKSLTGNQSTTSNPLAGQTVEGSTLNNAIGNLGQYSATSTPTS